MFPEKPACLFSTNLDLLKKTKWLCDCGDNVCVRIYL